MSTYSTGSDSDSSELPIIILTIQDDNNERIYKAFSSTQSTRSLTNLKLDVYHFVGYQDGNPTDIDITYGKLEETQARTANLTISERNGGIYFLVRSDGVPRRAVRLFTSQIIAQRHIEDHSSYGSDHVGYAEHCVVPPVTIG